jgi:hypothetical protein
MALTGLHILLTYQCNYECDHCFVWGSPWQTGTFILAQLDDVFHQALEVDTINEIYFEGGEAFLYHPILVQAVAQAHQLGFATGIVSNGFWATTIEDALVWLRPLAEAGLDSISVSCDLFHNDSLLATQVEYATLAARQLGIDTGTITLEPPTGYRDPAEFEPGEPVTGGDVMYRGRAAVALVDGLPRQPWTSFTACPYEDLVTPSRIHLDPLGYLHLCQGLVMGNLFERPLKQIMAEYDPESLPVVQALVTGGPAQIVQQFELPHESAYVDACHLCYTARQALRPLFPAELVPDQMYGVGGN